MLDLSDIVQSPEFAAEIIVERVFAQVAPNGRAQRTARRFPPRAATVLPAGADSVAAMPAGYRSEGAFDVYAPFELRGLRSGQEPDAVFFRGARYVVVRVDPYAVGQFWKATIALPSAQTDPGVSAPVDGGAG